MTQASTLPLLNQKGEKISEVPLDKKIFDGEVNLSLLHQAVRMYQANQRQGTHSTKTRGEVSGGGKKPWRQKGTGRARAGSIRSPLWRHGGVTFGPKPREYAYSLSKKIKRSALKSSLNAKLKDQEVILVDKVELKETKTKAFAAFLRALKVEGRALVVVEKMSDPLRLSSRNLPGVCLKTHGDVNAYDLLRYPKIVIEEKAFTALSRSCILEESPSR